MFDTLLKSKFYSKCKTAIKITKTRIELIKRKRNAMEKFLKKDIADLLKNGLDFNAYGRAEGILIELNMSACYNFVGEFCLCLLKQVSVMDKQRECPEDCREAVSSLVYAAARFADLPELRELRDIFTSKYGSTLEANINQEFVDRLKAMPPTKEMKIQLLQDVALESGKSWDSKALEQKLYVPPSSEHGLSDDTNDLNNALPKYKEEPINRINNKKTENKKRNSSVPSSPRKLNDLPSYRTIKTNVDKHKLQEHKANAIYAEDLGKTMNSFNKNDDTKTELDEKKPFQSKFSPPPPYHRRSSTEVKHENVANEKIAVHGGDIEDMKNKDIQIENQNKLRSSKIADEAKNDEVKFYQRKYAPVSYRRRKFSWDQDEDLENENVSSKDIKTELITDRNNHEEKSSEKRHSQSKFAPPAIYTEPKVETSIIEEKTEQPDEIDKAKPKPKSVRSVRSRRSMIPPDEVNIVKNDDSLNAIRQELATKPGHKITNTNEDEADILSKFKRDSPRSGKGSSLFQPDRKSVHTKLPTYDDFVTRVGNLSRN